ncbi:MAG: hypothetical protein H6682_03475 [Candidatus Eisenbacteria bacterium]|nr:hypothetical protein [Candidatus Eisenbacteria bacterium]
MATWIGPEGGVVEQPDCRVIVPAGAVEQNYQVSVLADGPAFQLLPASMEIDGPIEVWLRDPQGNSAQIQQQIELLDPATGAWTVFLGNRVGEWVRVVVDGDHRAYRLWLDLE